MYDDLFCDTTLEVGKTLSKDERDKLHLQAEKVVIYRIVLSLLQRFVNIFSTPIVTPIVVFDLR